MHNKKRWVILLFCLLLCILIHFYSLNASLVEDQYATHFYPGFSKIIRSIFGWISFSFGDLLWAALILFLVKQIFLLIRFLLVAKRRNQFKQVYVKATLSTLLFLSITYILFNIFWGINYNRVGIADQLQLKMDQYSLSDLKIINEVLSNKINESKLTLQKNNTSYPDNKNLFIMADSAYKKVSKKYAFLSYHPKSLKKSMWGWLGNYTGFLGYYNPITGEAQINTTVPKFTQPFTTCHEIAHQIGYAKEMEANFVGYLAASASTDTLFQYSVYTDLFTYANRTLFIADSSSARIYQKRLLPSVLDDFKERRKFALAHISFIEPFIRSIYGKFLESNQQPMGILSYDEVTTFIIAYYKKFGTI